MFYARNKYSYWPRGDVPYVIRNYPFPDIIKNAMKYIEDATGNLIRFSDVSANMKNIKAYLCFTISEQNFARNIGKMPGENIVELRAHNTLPKGAVVHEIFHALGFAHEHQSPSRDEYIKINYQNIRVKATQFSPLISHFTFEEPYDFESISHYDTYAFSIAPNELKTIEIVHDKDFHFYDVMGLKESFSDSDIKGIKKKYSGI